MTFTTNSENSKESDLHGSLSRTIEILAGRTCFVHIYLAINQVFFF